MKIPVLKFHDIFKEVIWGGERIAKFKNTTVSSDLIGESWELSPMPGHESVVDGGPFDGATINEVVEKYPVEILGKKVVDTYGAKFPLLIKFIDSMDDLSIQVHPDDTLASERHNCPGKTEMWYSVAPAEGAYLYAGFKRVSTPEEFLADVANHTIVDNLVKFYPKKGDVFFLPAGRVHSIGRGNFVCEIQEASDITYRIYDYDRRQSDGTPRELHLEQSVGAIDFADTNAAVKHVEPEDGKAVAVESCRYFTVDLLKAVNSTTIKAVPGSFTVVIAVEGNATLTDPDGNVTPLPQGKTVLVPASMEKVVANPVDGACSMLTVTI